MQGVLGGVLRQGSVFHEVFGQCQSVLAAWLDQDDFPGHQEWADEVERILGFLLARGQFGRLLPRLRARASQRDGALAEARTAFFFARNGFRIVRWEPEALSNRPGDLEIQWLNGSPIFIEVKGPGWESELTTAEQKAGRPKLPKDIHGEARWIDPAASVAYVIGKALPKFASDRPNLLVVVDDFFVSPMEWPSMLRLVGHRLTQRLEEDDCKAVGAIFLLRPICYGSQVDYLTHCIENPAAHPACKIPDPVIKGLSANNKLEKARRTV